MKLRIVKSLTGIVLATAVMTGSVLGSTTQVKAATGTEVFAEDRVNALVSAVEEQNVQVDTKDLKVKDLVKTATRTATQKAANKKVGKYPTRKGVILVTADKFKGIIPTGHAAIIYNSKQVIESLKNGVTTGRNDWNISKKTCYAVTPKKTTAKQDANVADWCKRQIKKKYNFNYFDTKTRKKFYCSQLVYAGFLDNYKVNLNTNAFKTPAGNPVHPMELVNTAQTKLVYRK